MRKFSLGRLLLVVMLFGSAAATAWSNFSWLLTNPPLTFEAERAGGSIAYRLTQTHLRPGDCVTLNWKVEGIQEIHFNDQGVTGQDQREICIPSNANQAPDIRLQVLFRDHIEVVYSPPVIFHSNLNLAIPSGLLIISLALWMAPLSSAGLFSRLEWSLSVFAPVGLGLVLALIGLFVLGGVVSIPSVDQFVNEPWYGLLDTARCGYYEVSPYSTRPERVLFDQIEHIDNSEGQILLFGTSNAIESLLPYDLTFDQRSHILNLSMGATTPLEYDTLFNYLDENKNMLHPKHGKTALVLAFWSAVFAKNPWHYIYQNVFRLYQRFDLLETSDIDWTLRPTQDLLSPILMAQARTASLFSRQLPLTWRRVFFPEVTRDRISDSASVCRPQNVDPVALERTDFWHDYHGGEGYILPNEATIPLERMAQRANEVGIPIVVINLPLPSWLRNTSFQRRYLAYIDDFGKRYGAPIYDLTDLLPNDEFRDTAHPTIDGRHILTQAMIDILVKEGLLSATS